MDYRPKVLQSKCTLVRDDYENREKYKTVVFEHSERNYYTEAKKPVEASRYFLFLRNDVWFCKDENENKILYRVVNEMIGYTEIASVYYADDLKVSTKYYLGDGKKTIWVEEVAYFQIDANQELHRCSYPGKTELDFPWSTPHRNRICVEQQGVSQFPFNLRTKVRQTVNGNRQYRFKYDYYFENFIPIKEEIWICKSDPSASGTAIEFIRVVNEIISTKPIHKLSYGSSIVYVELIPHTGTADYRFKSREIAYYDPQYGQNVKYVGKLKLVSVDTQENLDMSKRDVSFKLGYNKIYKTFVGPTGFDFRVGSRLEKTVGSKEDTVGCTRLTSFHKSAFQTQVRMKTRVESKAYASHRVEKYMESKYFSHSSQEVSECKSTNTIDNSEYSFYRVVNVLDFFVPVHEIESYDSVRISYKFWALDKKSVHIVDIKYLNTTDFTTLKYDGELDMDWNSKAPPGQFSDLDLTKNSDDIFHITGHYSISKKSLRDVVFETDYKPGQPQIIHFGNGACNLTVGDRIEGTATNKKGDVAECFLAKGEIVSTHLVTKSDISTTAKTKDNYNSISGQFFDPIQQQVWTCQVQNEVNMISFRRVRNIMKLKTESIQSLNYIILNDGNHMHSIAIGDNEYSHNVRSVFYENITTDESIKYCGNYVLKGKEKEIIGKQWMSGTEPVVGEEDWIKSVYNEKPAYETFDKSFIHRLDFRRTDGVALKLGSRWERKYGDELLVMNCDLLNEKWKSYDEYFNTYFRTTVSVIGEPVTPRDDFSEYFESLKQEYWECSATVNEIDYKMLRIFNQFSIKPKKCETIREFLYHDGFTFLVGEFIDSTAGCMEIVEVKYLDFNDRAVLKYEGKIKVTGAQYIETTRPVKAVRLKSVAKKDIHYSQRMFRNSYNEIGGVFRFGTNYNVPLFQLQKTETLFICEENESLNTEYNVLTDPKYLMKYIRKDDNKIEVEVPTKKFMEDYFSQFIMVWECSAPGEQSFIRVLRLFSSTDKTPVARIYNSDGVIINYDDQINEFGTTFTQIQIRQISYFIDKKPVQFDGFIPTKLLEEPPASNPVRFFRKEVENYQEAVNYMDFSTRTEGSYQVEIGSPWQIEMDTDEDDALCIKNVQHKQYKKEFGIEVNSRLKNRIGEPLRASAGERQMEGKSSIFDLMKQNIYDCVNRKGEEFYRVVNEIMELSMKVSGIYYHDGITIQLQSVPDETSKNTFIKIREVKYLRKTFEILKYNGRVTVLSNVNTDVKTWFQKLPDAEEYQMEEKTKNWGKKGKYWPMEVLRVYALHLDQSLFQIEEKSVFESSTAEQPRIFTKVIENKMGEKFLVGSPWEVSYTSDHQFRCIMDVWNVKNYLQFNTHIVMYIDDKHYVFDEETVLDYFELVDIEIWICVNDKDTVLRVVTELKGKIPIKVVEHYEGVKVDVVPLNDKEKTALIKEYKYVNATDFKVVKIGTSMMLQGAPVKAMELKAWLKDCDLLKRIRRLYQKAKERFRETLKKN